MRKLPPDVGKYDQTIQPPAVWTRRQLLQCWLVGITLPMAVSQVFNCRQQNLLMMESSNLPSSSATHGRLLSRPTQPTAIAPSRLVYLPKSYRVNRPAPLVLMLHGAGGDAQGGLSILQTLANSFEAILLAVDSRGQTWDMIRSRYGSDIAFIDSALAQTFSRYAINKSRVAIAGFSDGASYALSVGLGNGELFTHVIAFSPGFIAPARQEGRPQLFISHGKWDRVLPIERCSREIVPQPATSRL